MTNLRIVPHTLSPVQKVARVESVIHLKKILLSAKHRGWRYILTGDESWFYFTIIHDHIWLPEEALTPIRPRQTINTPKRMITILGSPLGFPLVQLLPQGQHFNARYFRRIYYKRSIKIVQRRLPKMGDETLPYC
jgi:hypothetical protein